MSTKQSENSEKDEESEYDDKNSYISGDESHKTNGVYKSEKLTTEIKTNVSQDDDITEEIKTSFHEITDIKQSSELSESSKFKIVKSEKQKSDFGSSESSGSTPNSDSRKTSSSQRIASNKYDDDDFIGNFNT